MWSSEPATNNNNNNNQIHKNTTIYEKTEMWVIMNRYESLL